MYGEEGLKGAPPPGADMGGGPGAPGGAGFSGGGCVISHLFMLCLVNALCVRCVGWYSCGVGPAPAHNGTKTAYTAFQGQR